MNSPYTQRLSFENVKRWYLQGVQGGKLLKTTRKVVRNWLKWWKNWLMMFFENCDQTIWTCAFSTSEAVAHALLRLWLYTVVGGTPKRAKFKGTCTLARLKKHLFQNWISMHLIQKCLKHIDFPFPQAATQLYHIWELTAIGRWPIGI